MRCAVALALDPDQSEIAARGAVRDIAFVDEREAQPLAGEAVGDRRTNEPAADDDGVVPLHRLPYLMERGGGPSSPRAPGGNALRAAASAPPVPSSRRRRSSARP